MHDNGRLTALLREADDATAPVAVDADALVSGVRRRWRGRRRRRRAGAAIVALALAGVGVWVGQLPGGTSIDDAPIAAGGDSTSGGHRSGRDDAPPFDAEALRREYERLTRQAEAHLLLARRLDGKARGGRDDDDVDPAGQLNQRVQQSATIMLRRAEAKAKQPALLGSARADLRRLIHLFPDSPAAAAARDHLRRWRDPDEHGLLEPYAPTQLAYAPAPTPTR